MANEISNKNNNKPKKIDTRTEAIIVSFVLGFAIAAVVLVIAVLNNRDQNNTAAEDQVQTSDILETPVPGSEAIPSDATTAADRGLIFDPEIIEKTDENGRTHLESTDIYGNKIEYAGFVETEYTETVSYFGTDLMPFEIGYGMTLTIGGNVNDAGGLVLDPLFNYDFASNPDEPYGFLIRATHGRIVYSGTPGNLNSFNDSGKMQFLITGRAYDELVPAQYINKESFGVKWCDSRDVAGNEPYTPYVFIHVIRLKDGSLMGSAKIEIKYDSIAKSFSFGAISRTDVLDDGSMSAEYRDEVVLSTIRFLNNGNKKFSGFNITEDGFKSRSDQCVVERTGFTWYGRFFDVSGDITNAGRYSGCDIYAVNIPYASTGNLTAYLAPVDQVDHLAYNLDYKLIDDEHDLAFIGYDAYNSAPFDKDTMASIYFEDEVKELGIYG